MCGGGGGGIKKQPPTSMRVEVGCGSFNGWVGGGGH